MKTFGLAGIICAVLLLSACASDDAGDKAAKPAKETKAERQAAKAAKLNTDDLICPQVAILQQAQDVHDFGRDKPDPAHLVASARMNAIEGDCGYVEGGIDINFTLHMRAMRGPRLGGTQVGFPYFIAVVDPAEKIVSRQLMTAQFEFAGLERRADAEVPLHVFIPLSGNALQAGPDYRVLVGFKRAKD